MCSTPKMPPPPPAPPPAPKAPRKKPNADGLRPADVAERLLEGVQSSTLNRLKIPLNI